MFVHELYVLSTEDGIRNTGNQGRYVEEPTDDYVRRFKIDEIWILWIRDF
jgi:hypothetical protein